MNKKLDQKGAVAIVSVVIFTIIITVIITAYLRSAVSKQQESVNYDFSNRAFYAAESGVQDTIRAIRLDPLKLQNKDTCDLFSGSDSTFSASSFGLSYNCQLINVTPSSISGTVIPNSQSAMIKLEPNQPISGTPHLVVRWSSQVKSPTEQVHYTRDNSNKTFKPVSNWFINSDTAQPIHPALKVAVFDHPSIGSFSRGQINQRQVILNPTAADDKDGSVNFNKSSNNVSTQVLEFFNNAECYNSDDQSATGMDLYSCKQTIDLAGYDFSSSAIYARIGSVYSSTNFSLELLDGSTVVPLRNSQAVIDITGKAGSDTYRRVKQAVQLTNFQIQYGPDAALVAGQGICKQFALGTTASVFAGNSGCNPLTN